MDVFCTVIDIISVCGSIPIEIPILWPRAVMVGPRPRVLLTLPRPSGSACLALSAYALSFPLLVVICALTLCPVTRGFCVKKNECFSGSRSSVPLLRVAGMLVTDVSKKGTVFFKAKQGGTYLRNVAATELSNRTEINPQQQRCLSVIKTCTLYAYCRAFRIGIILDVYFIDHMLQL